MLSQLPNFGVVAGWASPGIVDVISNDNFPRTVLPVPINLKKLRGTVKTAPTGAAMTIELWLGTISTGVLDGAAIGTITIAINAFFGDTTLSPIVNWPITKFLVPIITAVGSVVPGTTLAITAEGQLVT